LVNGFEVAFVVESEITFVTFFATVAIRFVRTGSVARTELEKTSPGPKVPIEKLVDEPI
jgi:hypothetical protein